MKKNLFTYLILFLIFPFIFTDKCFGAPKKFQNLNFYSTDSVAEPTNINENISSNSLELPPQQQQESDATVNLKTDPKLVAKKNPKLIIKKNKKPKNSLISDREVFNDFNSQIEKQTAKKAKMPILAGPRATSNPILTRSSRSFTHQVEAGIQPNDLNLNKTEIVENTSSQMLFHVDSLGLGVLNPGGSFSGRGNTIQPANVPRASLPRSRVVTRQATIRTASEQHSFLPGSKLGAQSISKRDVSTNAKKSRLVKNTDKKPKSKNFENQKERLVNSETIRSAERFESKHYCFELVQIESNCFLNDEQTEFVKELQTHKLIMSNKQLKKLQEKSSLKSLENELIVVNGIRRMSDQEPQAKLKIKKNKKVIGYKDFGGGGRHKVEIEIFNFKTKQHKGIMKLQDHDNELVFEPLKNIFIKSPDPNKKLT